MKIEFEGYSVEVKNPTVQNAIKEVLFGRVKREYTKRSAWKKWDDADIETLKGMAGNGWRIRRIAKELGRSVPAVNSQLGRMRKNGN